jgi:hypothetical protein
MGKTKKNALNSGCVFQQENGEFTEGEETNATSGPQRFMFAPFDRDLQILKY